MMGWVLLSRLLAWGDAPPVAVEVLDEQARPVSGARYVALVPQFGGPQRPEVEAVVAEGERAVLSAPPGAYYLICAAQGFLPTGLWRGTRLPVELRPGQAARSVCQLSAAGVAEMTAVADGTGKPLKDAQFSLAALEKVEELSPLAKDVLGRWFGCRTNAQSRCQLYGPLGKRAEVVVSAPAYARLLIPGVAFSHPPAQGPTVALAPAGTVEVALEGAFPWQAEQAPGLILLPAHLRHLQRVRERRIPQQAPIQEDGVAVFFHVAPGSYVLEAVPDSGEGWEKLNEPLGATVELVAGERLRVVVTLANWRFAEPFAGYPGLPTPVSCAGTVLRGGTSPSSFISKKKRTVSGSPRGWGGWGVGGR